MSYVSPSRTKIFQCAVMALMALFLASCSLAPDWIGEKDRQKVYDNRNDSFAAVDDHVKGAPLTLPMAMAMALQNNLDVRLATIERQEAKGDIIIQHISALPSLDAKAEYIGRDSNRATSSISAISNTQSLEPSYSTDEHRRVMSLGVSYSTLDLGLGYYNTNQAKGRAGVAEERRRKVLHNLIQDVRNAYWRVVALQTLEQDRERLVENAKKAKDIIGQIEKEGLRLPTTTIVQQKDIQSLMQDYFNVYQNLAPARVELAALIGLDPSEEIRVADDLQSVKKDKRRGLRVDYDDLVAIALTSRPEIIEQLHQENISKAELNKIIVESFPVLSGVVSGDYDSNSFQQEPVLANFSVSLAANLVKLVTTPFRYEQGENQVLYEKEKLKALTAAVMTQTYLARMQYGLANDRLDLIEQSYKYNDRLVTEVKREIEAELSADIDLVETEFQKELSEAAFVVAYADWQASYGQLLNALGLNPFPETIEGVPTSALSQEIDKSLKAVNSDNLQELASKIKTYNPKTR